MLKFHRAAFPLVATALAFAPAAARADVGDDMMSFFGKAANVVKTRVVALPDQLGISQLVESEKAEHIAVAPAAVIRPENAAFTARPDLSQIKAPTVTAAMVALPEPSVEKPARRFYCAEYVRIQKGLPVFGDAKYWWEKANSFMTGWPSLWRNSVMVFATSMRLKRGHVAVVTDIVSPREIRVDQANWQNHGEIDHSTPVLDVSPANDWTRVRVWDTRSRQFGAHVYPISGFIVTAPVQQARN